MERYDLYRDIAERTDGDIYIGVVGPVRTGKSTFIARFMEQLVLPAMESGPRKDRAVDELPQSGSGRSIMTTQPKFVPNEAVSVELADHANLRVRMVDCVGYLVKGAIGKDDGDAPRMVKTPWFDHDIPFEEAAELGTRKVINDHSTIGLVVTTDGSITDLPRLAYVEAEERVVREMKAVGKPFIIVLNSTMPDSDDAKKLQQALHEKYDVPVILLDVAAMNVADIAGLLERVLYEFPLTEVRLDMPEWVQALPTDHWLVQSVLEGMRQSAPVLSRVRDHIRLPEKFESPEYEGKPQLAAIELGRGAVTFALPLPQSLFYRVLGEQCGTAVKGDAHLLTLMADLVAAKREYDRIADALDSVRQTGYGLVAPTQEELTLEEPEIVKQGNRFGVRLKASAPSLHLIRVDIQTEVSPIVGTEKQSEELVKYLLSEFESDPARIWNTNMFGKSLHELVKEGLSNKLMRMPEDVQDKIQETLQRIINDGSGGLICILL